MTIPDSNSQEGGKVEQPVAWLDSFGEPYRRREDAMQDSDGDPRPLYARPTPSQEGRSSLSVEEMTAPHPALQSASFVLAFGGEGAAAYVVHGGWGAMLLRFVQETIDYAATALPDAGHVNAEEWSGWMESLHDLDEWTHDEDNRPYCFISEVGEISTVTIYRLLNTEQA